METTHQPTCNSILSSGIAVGNRNGKSHSLTKIDQFWIADDNGFDAWKDRENFSFVNCAKNPYHKQALGYKTNGCPKDHPEYLYAVRGNRFIMNWIDGDDPKFISDKMIDDALTFMESAIELGNEVLVNCNQGRSRSPSLVLLYLVKHRKLNGTYEQILRTFNELYHQYRPGSGIEQYCRYRINKMVDGYGRR